MLNEKLPNQEIKETLEEFIDPLDYLLDELVGTDRRRIPFNRKLRGKIHHALNISNYRKPEFRYKLLSYSDDDVLKRYLIEIGLMQGDATTINNKEELIDKASKIPWKDDDNTKAFVKIFGYEESLVPLVDEYTPNEEVVLRSDDPLKTLYDYQSDISFRALELVENRSSRSIIQMPTGSGKTRTAMELITLFLNQGIASQNERQVLWVAESEELCEQAIESFKHVWRHIGRKKATIHRLFGSSVISSFQTNSIIVASYGKLRFRIKSREILPEPDLIFCDEAHNVIATTYKDTIEKIKKDGTRVVGLTATPIRGIESQENEELMEFFHHKLIDIDVDTKTDENAIEYLQRRGYLAYYEPRTIETNRTFRMSPQTLELLSLDRDLSPSFLNHIAKDNRRNVLIARLLKELAERQIKVLYFAPSVFQSKLMCALLIALGFNAAHIDGLTPHPYRRDVVNRFRNGSIKIMCNFDVFSVGFDDPKIDAVVIARPTRSIVLHQQMIGRGMRGPKMGGHETFELYRIHDVLPDIEIADQYFTDIWKTS